MFKQFKWIFCCLLLCLSICFSGPIYADHISKEYQIKSAILYKLTKFISWPEQNKNSILLCLVQPEPFGNYLDTLITQAESTANTQTHTIMRLNQKDDLSGCQIVFIPKGNAVSHLPKHSSALIISDEHPIADTPIHINLFVDDHHVRFSVNIDNIRDDNIKLNPQLLTIATIVKNTRKGP